MLVPGTKQHHLGPTALTVVLCTFFGSTVLAAVLVNRLAPDNQRAVAVAYAGILATTFGLVTALSRGQRFLAQPPHPSVLRRGAGLFVIAVGGLVVALTMLAVWTASIDAQGPWGAWALLPIAPVPVAVLLILAGARIRALPPTMSSRQLEDRFRSGLPDRPDPLAPLEAMFEFYRDVRATDCLDNAGDTLHFRAGPSHDATRLELELSRRLTPSTQESQPGATLSVTYDLPADDAQTTQTPTVLTCASPRELTAFRGSVLAHAATCLITAGGAKPHIRLRLAHPHELPQSP